MIVGLDDADERKTNYLFEILPYYMVLILFIYSIKKHKKEMKPNSSWK
jgi:hypothetical protein